MDVATQKNSEMTMKEWEKYYNDPRKDRLLNVISLEFSHTRLENYVKRPNIVSIFIERYVARVERVKTSTQTRIRRRRRKKYDSDK